MIKRKENKKITKLKKESKTMQSTRQLQAERSSQTGFGT